MADPSARRRLSLIKAVRTGFGPLYNVANPPKQAMLLEWYFRGLVTFPGFASGGGGAYLGMAKRLVKSHERSGTA
jgi:hypothetical protein